MVPHKILNTFSCQVEIIFLRVLWTLAHTKKIKQPSYAYAWPYVRMVSLSHNHPISTYVISISNWISRIDLRWNVKWLFKTKKFLVQGNVSQEENSEQRSARDLYASFPCRFWEVQLFQVPTVTGDRWNGCPGAFVLTWFNRCAFHWAQGQRFILFKVCLSAVHPAPPAVLLSLPPPCSLFQDWISAFASVEESMKNKKQSQARASNIN